MHKFQVGQSFDLIPSIVRRAAKGTYEIIRLIPDNEDDPQYRVKSAAEPHERVVPDNRHSTVVLDEGRRYNCKIIDISISGAAIELAVRPAMGTPVTLGRMRARVVRHFQDGVAVEFASAQEMLTVVQQNLRIN